MRTGSSRRGVPSRVGVRVGGVGVRAGDRKRNGGRGGSEEEEVSVPVWPYRGRRRWSRGRWDGGARDKGLPVHWSGE